MLTFTREADIPYILKTLNSMFASVTYGMGYSSREAAENTNSKRLYDWQVEYAYRVNEIAKSPNYIKPKLINSCVDYIKNVESEKLALQASK